MSTGPNARLARLLGWAATALSLMLFAIHTFVGGVEVAGPLRLSELPESVVAPAWMVWHMVTGSLLLMAAMFGWATRRKSDDMMLAATAMAVVFTVAALAAPVLLGVGLAVLPQGTLFAPVALVGYLAWRKGRARR